MTWLASIPSQIDANGSACAWAAACSPLRPALLGIWRQHLYDILNERKPVSPTVAVRLGKLFGDGAGVWARMQSAYDTCGARPVRRDQENTRNQNEGGVK
jgi:hypothetical protein